MSDKKDYDLNDVVKELKILKKISVIINGEKLESEIAKYANTNERKIIWTLIDGKQKSEDIAKQTGKTKRAVDQFLDLLEKTGLIEERHYGIAPSKSIDYVPVSWLTLHNTTSENEKIE